MYNILSSFARNHGSTCSVLSALAPSWRSVSRGAQKLGSINQSINQSKTLFNFEFVDSKTANISEENKSVK